MLPPLGIIFGLLVGFIAAKVWSDFEKAKVTVANEASALRAVNLLAASLPAEPEGTRSLGLRASLIPRARGAASGFRGRDVKVRAGMTRSSCGNGPG